ncbi:phosphotransferase [uncultured Novosphingobium sp.]|uniref:phosphotransferase n=1 Tax=uncultured Novosphingobium sp. TaxID=292277 RepID=UPI00374A2BC9
MAFDLSTIRPLNAQEQRMMDETAGMLTMELPESVYDIDTDWMRRAIHAGGHDVTVTRAERIDVIHSTCTKARFELTYDRDIGLPTRMILKGAFEDHSERMQDMYRWEARFYRQIAPHVPLNLPATFWAGIDKHGWRAATLMEDLVARNVTFCRAQQPFGYDHIRNRLDQLAGMHAQTWNSPELLPGGRWSWVAGRFDASAMPYTDYYLEKERWNHFMEAPRGVVVARELQDREWMRHALRRIGEIEREDAFCLIHGDTHPGNLFVEDGGNPGFFDPTVSRSSWWLEVSYHLVSAIDIAHRRAWEAPLLTYYLTALERAGGPRIDFDHAWLRYRQGLVYGLFIFLINETTFQTEATNAAYTARFGIAAIDHDTVRMLG